MQIKEGGAVEVEEIVAVTMGPESAVRALHKAVSLGADRSVHLTDAALAGSDVAATGYALAQTLKRESPDLVLLGQQSDDGECYTIGAVVAEHLQMPSLTQVIKMDVDDGKLRCERQAEYGYDTVEIKLPAVISVGDAINEPRYPSLKAIMGAKKKPLDTVAAADADIDAGRVGGDNSAAQWTSSKAPPPKAAGHDHRGRGHERDGREDRRLARREEADLAWPTSWSTPCTTRAPSTRTRSARSPRAHAWPPSWAASATRSSSAATTSPTSSPPRLGAFGATKVFRARGPRASRSRSSTRWPRSSPTTATATRCSAAACSASRSAPAWPRAWAPASPWRSPPCASRAASSSPSARSSATRPISRDHTTARTSASSSAA